MRVAPTVEFAAQAVTGILVAMKRQQSPPVTPTTPTTDDFRQRSRRMLVNYLNRCWMSLLADDDAYIADVFARVDHDAPLCWFTQVLNLCLALLPARDPATSTPPSPLASAAADTQTLDSGDDDSLDKYRLQHFGTAIEHATQNVRFKRGPRSCRSLTLEQERQAWRRRGCASEEIFRLEDHTDRPGGQARSMMEQSLVDVCGAAINDDAEE